MGWGLDRSCVSRHRMQDRCANLYQSWSPGIHWGWKRSNKKITCHLDIWVLCADTLRPLQQLLRGRSCVLPQQWVGSVRQHLPMIQMIECPVFSPYFGGNIGHFVTPNNYILDLYVYLLCNKNLFSPHHRRRGRVSSFKASLTFLWGGTWLTEKLG